MAPNIETGKPRYEVKIITEDPAVTIGLHGRSRLEILIEEALDAGFDLRAFNTIGDGSASPNCVALLVREVKP
jgi:hypothetical protein